MHIDKRHFHGSTISYLRIGQFLVKHRLFIGILFLSFNPLGFASETGLDQVSQSIQQLVGERVTAMAAGMGLVDYEYNIESNQLDSRLTLSTCSQTLQVKIPNPLSLGRSQIKVSCKDKKAWAVNVPININLITQVVVLSQPVSRNTVLGLHHLDYRNINISQLRNGYYLKKDFLIGKQSKRALAGETVLNGHLVLPALLVHKGDRVMIMAKKGAMSVKMPGEAMNNGREGKQIRVKNIRSNRIIRAKVVDSGLVVVNF